MSAADELRQAARTLREAAEAATPARWFAHTGPGGYPNEVRTGEGPGAGLPVLFDAKHLIGTAHYMRGEDAHLIAMLGPDVALAMADWLEATVAGDRPWFEALALAALINGRADGGA